MVKIGYTVIGIGTQVYFTFLFLSDVLNPVLRDISLYLLLDWDDHNGFFLLRDIEKKKRKKKKG